MAPLPQNSTNRLFLDYTSRGIEHTAVFRPAGDLFGSDITTWAQSIAELMAFVMCTDDSVTSARYSETGTNFSLPVPFTPEPGIRDPSGFTWAEDPESAFVTVPLRSQSTGRRGRLCMFTAYRFGNLSVPWPSNNRFDPGENTIVDNWIATLKDLSQGASPYITGLVVIDGSFPVLYDYLNISKNAYWERKQR